MALSKLYESCDNDAKTKSEAESLINALENFKFLLDVLVWYDILLDINTVSKMFQSKSMCIDSTIKQLENMLSYFEKYFFWISQEIGQTSREAPTSQLSWDPGEPPSTAA